MGRTWGLIFLGLAILAAPLSAQDVETGIIQVKLDRIYFGAGAESGVQSGMAFSIDCGGKTLSGTIEYSGPGVSYSQPIPLLDTLAIDAGCKARLITARADSSAMVAIGTDMPLKFFDLEHEPALVRTQDTILPNLLDSAQMSGNAITLYFPPDAKFSDGSPVNSESLLFFFRDLGRYSRSYLVRYFFAKLFPIDSGGIELVDGHTVRLNFYHPFPHAAYLLSHPDFAVYNENGKGAGPFTETSPPDSREESRSFIPNPYYRGTPSRITGVTVTHFSQQNRMKFALDNNQLDAVIGFGFESDLAGTYTAKASYPEIAVLISNIGTELFSQALFPTSLYYCFNPDLSHIYFQYGEAREVDRWVSPSSSDTLKGRYYPYDILKGRSLFGSITRSVDSVVIAYEDPILAKAAEYFADIVAREGMKATCTPYLPGLVYDVRVAFLPASDEIMPLALIAAVLELNDQNIYLPAGRRLSRPGWDDLDGGSRFYEPKNRVTFFNRAEETVFQEGGFFPLFQPYLYALAARNVSGIVFDSYGYPRLDKLVKFAAPVEAGRSRGKP